MVKCDLHLIDVSLVLLLDPEGLLLGPGLSFKRGLHGLKCPLVILPAVLELLFLLLDTAVDLLPDLRHLELGPQHLVLLLLKSSFSLLEAVLQLFFLNLELPARFVELMHRPSALAELIQEV